MRCLNMKMTPTDIEFQWKWRTDKVKGGKVVKRRCYILMLKYGM